MLMSASEVPVNSNDVLFDTVNPGGIVIKCHNPPGLECKHLHSLFDDCEGCLVD
jgi:hypothetical protein